MRNLLAKVANFVGANGEGALQEGYAQFKNVVLTVLPIVISVVLLLGMFFGISMGIKFAKAEDTEARDKAKGQLINLAIGIGVTAVILLIAYVLLQAKVFDGLFQDIA